MKIKRAATDFTADGLPHTRPQVFVDCIKIRHRLLFRLGGVLLLFALPLVCLLLTHDVTLATIASHTDVAEEERLRQMFSADMYFRLSYIVAYIVLGVGMAGTARVVRQLAWGEGVFFRRDFFDGVKLNGGAYAVVFGLFGVTRFICAFMDTATAANTAMAVVKYMPSVTAVVLLAPVGLLVLNQAVVYKSKLLKLTKNAFLMYIKTLPTTFIGTLCALLPFFGVTLVEMFAVPVYVKALFVALYVALLLPLTQLGEFLYCNMLFDRFINSVSHPQMVDKGVWRKNDTAADDEGKNTDDTAQKR